jgi:hypothetical protein
MRGLNDINARNPFTTREYPEPRNIVRDYEFPTKENLRWENDIVGFNLQHGWLDFYGMNVIMSDKQRSTLP